MLSFLPLLLDLFKHSDFQSQAVQDVIVVVELLVLVSRDVQTRNKPVLIVFACLLQLFREAKWRPERLEEVPYVTDRDEAVCVWVEAAPSLIELFYLLFVEEFGILLLDTIVSLQDDGDKKLEKDQTHHKEVAIEVNDS